MIRERASTTPGGPGSRVPSLVRRPTFASRARERAAELAVALVEEGHDLEDGAFLAIDPRDPAGRALATAELVREGVTARQAEWALARAVEEATRQGDVVVGIAWSDAASLREEVAGVSVAGQAGVAWAGALAAPLPAGFVRLVTISEGRLALALVAC